MTYIHVSFRICYGERKENEKRHDEEKSERETHEYVQENVGFTTQLHHFIPLYANGGPDIVRTCATLAWVHVSPTLTEELRCASNNRKFSHTDSLFSHIPSLSVQDNGLSLKNISLIFFFQESEVKRSNRRAWVLHCVCGPTVSFPVSVSSEKPLSN